MRWGGIVNGRQLKAARALAGVTQQQLANASGLHVNSVRYLERQDRIAKFGHSANLITMALEEFGVRFMDEPTLGVRLLADMERC